MKPEDAVTRCDCRWLERADAEPSYPVEFDATANEYHLVLHGKDGTRIGAAMLRFCPGCGKSAPESRRGELFAKPNSLEVMRLTELTRGCSTFDEVIAHLGPPDHDVAAGLVTTTPATEERPPETTVLRVVSFAKLSETADVRFTERTGGGVRVSFVGKYIGPPAKRGSK